MSTKQDFAPLADTVRVRGDDARACLNLWRLLLHQNLKNSVLTRLTDNLYLYFFEGE